MRTASLSREAELAPPTDPDAGDEALTAVLLERVRVRVGVDFAQYRTVTIARRIRNRMLTLGIPSVGQYVSFVATHPEETDALAERLVIKVSRFYRNTATFDLLRAQVLPALREAVGVRGVRVWCAGCGCGEEAYTFAMLLDEAGLVGTVHATDIDGAALAATARGLYPSTALDELPPDLAHRYLEPVTAHGCVQYRVRDGLRDRVHVSRHDVTVDPPPASGPCAIVSCRNVLIYLQPAAQARALRHLGAALAAGSTLVLGEAEWPSADLAERLQVQGARARVFSAVRDWTAT